MADDRLDYVIALQDEMSQRLKKIQGGLDAFGDSAEKQSKRAAISFTELNQATELLRKGFGLARDAFESTIGKAIDRAEGFEKLSQRIGVTVEELSTLEFAAQQSGTSIEGLEMGFKGLAKKLEEVQAGGKPAIKTFADLGISQKQLEATGYNTRKVLDLIADGMSQMEDGAMKSAIAQRLMEESGTKLIPMLNKGSAGLARMQKEAKALGAEISTHTAKQAAALKDDVKRLNTAWEGLSTELARRTLPALGDIVERMAETAVQSGLLEAGLEGVAEAWRQLQSEVTGEKRDIIRIRQINAEIEALEKSIAAIQGKATNTDAGRLWLAGIGASDYGRKQVSGLREELKKLRAERAELLKQSQEFSESDFDGFLKEVDIPNRPRKTIAEDTESKDLQSTDDLYFSSLERQQMATLGHYDAMQIWQTEHQAATQASAQAHFDQMFSLGKDANKRQEKADRLSAAYRAEQQRRKYIMAVRYEMAFTSALSSLAEARILSEKTAGRASAAISMYTGAAKALTLPFPENLAAWAQVLAHGRKAIKGIDSVSLGGVGGLGGGGGGGATNAAQAAPVEPLSRTEDTGRPPPGTVIHLSVSTAASDAEQLADTLVPLLESRNRDGNFVLGSVSLG